jgi:hypothetical protein
LGARLTILFIDHLQTTSFLEGRGEGREREGGRERRRERGRKRFRKEIITIKLREVLIIYRT